MKMSIAVADFIRFQGHIYTFTSVVSKMHCSIVVILIMAIATFMIHYRVLPMTSTARCLHLTGVSCFSMSHL
uniref:Uncharacterized protein n=1 Tax=Glossina brevipalpis TaxID=37001 RepID=A0A1A9VZD8_9MUSC